MNKLSKLLLLLFVVGGVASCSVENNNSSSSSNSSSSIILPSNSTSSSVSSIISAPIAKEELTITAKLFINNISSVDENNISIEDKGTLDAAKYIYATLTDGEKALPSVVAAKAKLDAAIAEFNIIYSEYLTQREAEETGYAFVELVDTVKDLDALIKEDLDFINELLTKYELLSENARNLSVVVEAKANLDAAKSYVESLVSMSDEEYAALQFIALLNKLPVSSELTILDVDKVDAACNLYLTLSDDNKNLKEVKNAKSKLDMLVMRANQLKAVQANADAFIEMVWSLPSYDQLEWQSAAHNALITAAENAYNKLTEEERQVTGVASALTQLQTVRNTFDNLKEPYDISKLSFSMPWGAPINTGKGTNYTCAFTYAAGKDHISVFTQQYGIPKEELSKHLKVNLNMYIEAGAVASEPLYQFDITEDWSNLSNPTYVQVLKELAAAGDERIFSGMGICFTLNVESLNDNYANSKYSGFMAGQKIHWEG